MRDASMPPAIARRRISTAFERAADVPARHDVGIGVVVDFLVIFVRPDNAADVAAPIGLHKRPACPEARCLQNDFRAGSAEEFVIACDLPVLPDRVSDVGADMLFLRAAENRDHPAIGTDDLGRRCFQPRIRQIPRRKERHASPCRRPFAGRH